MTAGERFRAARGTLGLTQQALADVMGYGDKMRISDIERGVRDPSPAADRLLQAYLDGYRPSDWPGKRPAAFTVVSDRQDTTLREAIIEADSAVDDLLGNQSIFFEDELPETDRTPDDAGVEVYTFAGKFRRVYRATKSLAALVPRP